MGPSDEVLISQTLALKDSDAFGELVRRHQSRVLLLHRRLCRDGTLAEDLTQETFLRAWQKLHTYRGSGSFQGWLAKLGHNVFLQHRRRHRMQRLEAELDEAGLQTESNRTPDETATADLDRLLGVLDAEDQTILVLTYAMGLTNVEVAEVLEMPAGTIKARIHRAKQKIQLHLDEGHEPTVAERAPRPRMRKAGFAGRLLGQLTGG